MRKLLVVLAVGLLTAALAIPASAADFKYSGAMRIRGISSDNTDRNNDIHDGVQGYDSMVRPRFTATSEGGKIWAIYELDMIDGNYIIGQRTGRTTVGTNRWLVDFSIPGTTLRARFGKTDYTSPDKEIYDSFGRSRKDGMAAYGKLTSNLSLSAFTQKTQEKVGAGNRFGTAADDRDDYYIALAWKAAPNFTLTPWFAVSHMNNNPATAQVGHMMYYYAVNAKAKVGIISADVSGIYEDGKIALYNRTGAGKPSDTDIEAWALLARIWATFGKLKVGFYATIFTGDSDPVVSTGNQAQQKDKKLKRFVLPDNNGTGWIEGPQILTSRWNNMFSLSARVPGTVTNVTMVGSGSNTQLNGAQVYEVRAMYQATKTLGLLGGVGVIQSMKKAPNRCSDTNGNGVCDPGEAISTTYKSSKNFGTEVDLGFKWKMYKELEFRGVASYLWAGDYGRATGADSLDDTWQLMWQVMYSW